VHDIAEEPNSAYFQASSSSVINFHFRRRPKKMFAY